MRGLAGVQKNLLVLIEKNIKQNFHKYRKIYFTNMKIFLQMVCDGGGCGCGCANKYIYHNRSKYEKEISQIKENLFTNTFANGVLWWWVRVPTGECENKYSYYN